jgi:hypothetical protein
MQPLAVAICRWPFARACGVRFMAAVGVCAACFPPVQTAKTREAYQFMGRPVILRTLFTSLKSTPVVA